MDERKAKLLFMMLPFLVIIVVGAILVLFATTTYEEGKGMVFYNPLGVPGILAILAGLMGLLFLRLTKH